MSAIQEGCPFSFAFAQPFHAQSICNLVNSAYKKELTRATNVPRFRTSEEVKKLIEKTTHVAWFILMDKDQMIGSLQVLKDKEMYSLNAFAISEDYQGKGLGPLMMKRAENDLKLQGVNMLFLKVISVTMQQLNLKDEWYSNHDKIEATADSLASFYTKMGFVFTGLNEIPSIEWQKQTRKADYQGRVFFREMVKTLTSD